MDDEMTGQHENTPATVPLAQQAGEFPAEWQWVERGVWNARMLTGLLTKGKGQKWFRLYDKVFAERNLIVAFQQVFSKHGAAGVDHVTVEEFARRSPESLWELLDELQHKTYRPQAIRRVYIPKPGTTDKRPLGIPTVRDRIVQAAVVNVIEPIFEREFAEHSYGFRPGRGCGEAVQRVTELIHSGFVYIVDADLKSYFDTIPHENLLQRISERIPDGSVLSLIRSFLNAQILEEMQMWNPEAGAPQGAVLSPLLSNIYLNPLDHLMPESGYEMVRYADDFVILCRTAEDAQRALNAVQTWVTDNGLILHPTKTKIVNVEREGFDFLGFHFIATTNYPRAKSVEKLQTALRQKTKRTRGDSLHSIIRDVNQRLRGWYGYFQVSRTGSHLFRRLDSWLRMRLRSILRRRAHRRGKGRGKDHQRWPNKFFETLGLFSLHAARVVRSILSEVKPSTGEPDAGDLHVRFGGRGVSTQ